MSITGEPDGPPLKVGVAVADITTGMFATIGTLAALRDAELTGRGHHVQVSLFDSQLAWLANRGSDWLVGGEEPQRLGNAHPAIVPYEAFETRDGFVIVAIGTNEQFARFCTAAGLARAGRRRALCEQRPARRAPARARGAPGGRDPRAAHGGMAGHPGGRERAGRAGAHDPRGLRARALRRRGARASPARPACARCARRSASTAPTSRRPPPRRCSASTPTRCSPSSATTTTPAPRCCAAPAAWPDARELPGPDVRVGLTGALGGAEWVASPLPPGSVSSRPQAPDWPTDRAGPLVDWCSFPRKSSPRAIGDCEARRRMSATPLEAGSDVTSLIADEAVSYDDTGAPPAPAARHAARQVRAVAAGSCAAAS